MQQKTNTLSIIINADKNTNALAIFPLYVFFFTHTTLFETSTQQPLMDVIVFVITT